MARVPMVTRTVTTTTVNAMCVDTTKGEVCNRITTLPRTYNDDAKLLKKVKEQLETAELKVVQIVDKTENETLYGMSEQDFINSAKVLTDRNHLPEDEETETTEFENPERVETEN